MLTHESQLPCKPYQLARWDHLQVHLAHNLCVIICIKCFVRNDLCAFALYGLMLFSVVNPGLHTLRAAISGGPWSIRSAINYTWSGTTHTPCHDVDPNCKFCPFSLPANLCGSPVLDATGAPAYFCNAHAVACTNGRITNLNVSWTALEFSQLPASGLAQFTKLQELSKSS